MTKRVHILGICGTFMGGIALLARDLGYEVAGSDANVYPPMSTMLEDAGIKLLEGYSPHHLEPIPDLVVIGNALSRGNAAVEFVLDQGIPYISGPQWLGENLLRGRHVAAVAGTHGKTTTSAMLAWILECEGYDPGFLIGGLPDDFGGSARLGTGPFVVEADEYDSAFFDKRSKFVHYKPSTLIINNLEFDHADIFDDLSAIQTQFHHLIRCVPGNGKIMAREGSAINEVLARGCWSTVARLGADKCEDWRLATTDPSCRKITIVSPLGETAQIDWNLIGQHNADNALASVAAACELGVNLTAACRALNRFQGVKRRLELLGAPNGIRVYDDFAHHPTAIRSTIDGLRCAVGGQRIIAVIELRSNTMKRGVHQLDLLPATENADAVYWFEPTGLDWSISDTAADYDHHHVFHCTQQLHDALVVATQGQDHVVIMSNGSFGGLHRQLLQSLSQ
jgi:UDP-N-acetylmuramate: L-alanyl-gamma-D-glutamyl-meso-diaminopimelate ligase